MFLSNCDYEIGILERMMACASQQAGPRSHTNQGETRAAGTLSVPPGRNMSPPCNLSLIYVRPTAYRSHVEHRSNAHQRGRFIYSPGTQFHRKEPKEFLFDSRQGQDMYLMFDIFVNCNWVDTRWQ